MRRGARELLGRMTAENLQPRLGSLYLVGSWDSADVAELVIGCLVRVEGDRLVLCG